MIRSVRIVQIFNNLAWINLDAFIVLLPKPSKVPSASNQIKDASSSSSSGILIWKGSPFMNYSHGYTSLSEASCTRYKTIKRFVAFVSESSEQLMTDINLLAKHQLSLSSDSNIETSDKREDFLLDDSFTVPFGEDYHHQRCTYCPTETTPISCPPDCFCKHPPDDGRDHI